jgi:4-amino-4-deoxy-L-arabinose transferase-like glycosyltransferase
VPIAASMGTVVLTCRLGARLYGGRAGLMAGLMLATMLGFVLEARTLRPDCLVVLSVVGAIFCWHVAETGEPARRRGWLAGMSAALGAGMLAKGFVPPLIAAIPIGFATVRAHGLAGLARLRPGLGLVVVAAIVLPWHLAAAIANPGFAYDYVVNQHVLFALDRKVPRDSDGDTLAFFWQAFLGRSAPWVLLAPFTLREGAGGLASGEAMPATTLLWVWLAGTMGVFSLTPSRLEHYSLPVLPAVALLAARAWQTAAERGVGIGLRAWAAAIACVFVAAGILGLRRGPELAATAYWIPQAPGLMALIVPAAAVAIWMGLLLAVAAAYRSATGIVAALLAGIAPFLAIVVRALIEAEALFSWRPVARALERVPAETEIVFQAPTEYQIVGALDFYLGRTVTMLEPPGGYAAPPYLRDQREGMFIGTDELDRRWRSGRPLALVTDPHRRRDAPDGLVPAPFHVLDRFGDRWVLTNFPAPSAH